MRTGAKSHARNEAHRAASDSPATRPIRPGVSARPRKRRSQAERTAQTRSAVIAAVVDAIAERGFQGATAQEITQRAGVTWGAVQHHFGGKDGLLLAVLEDSFQRFAERLADVPLERASIAERVDVFVERAWEHFRSRHFRSTFEILLNYLGREEHADAGDWRTAMTRAWDGVWSRVFAGATVSRRKSLMLQHFTVSTLSGLAATLMFEGKDAILPRQELDLVKDCLARALSASRT
jgi:AcrR family transcriptional regulator